MRALLVFDLDGTLIDSLPDIAAALDRTLAADGLGPLPPQRVARMIGDGARKLVERGYQAAGRPLEAAALDAATARYLELYEADPYALTRPYDGVAETLDRLAEQGFVFAVCTNKPEAPARAILAHLGLLPRFLSVGGGDSFPMRKPDPGHLIGTIEAAGGIPARAAMIGDHQNDIDAGRGAGVALTVFAGWGYGEERSAADTRIRRFADLPGVLGSLGG